MQKLLLKDYDKIKPYLDDADYEGYNSNFVTMMMWDHEYEIFYEIKENYLIMLHTYMNEKFFAMPFCKPEYYQEALEYMLEYANKHNFIFRIDLAVEKSKILIEELYGNKFLYLHDEDFDDYIYSKASLETLSGKKMQKRRNHFNAFFKEHPDYIYKEIEDEDIDNVLQCLKKWDFSRRIEESVVSEYIGIVYLLVHRHELNIKTGCIYIDNKLEAFIIGSPLKHSTIQIHVEKANKDIRGLYVAIGKLFLEQNYENYEFVNREEDMGLESLRKAKRALHPVKLLKKYTIILNNQTINQASDKDLYNIIDLWRSSFEDEDEKSTNFYFMNRYQKENTYVLKNNDLVVSMLQIIPYTLIFDEKEEDVYFILGVATNKTYRKQGLMKKLMNYVLSLSKYQNAKIILQAYNPELYYQFGFSQDYYHKITEVDNNLYENNFLIKTTKNNDYIKLLNLYNQFCKKYTGYRKRNIEYYQNYLALRCEAFDEKIKVFDLNNKSIGYVIYSEEDVVIKISEIIYLEQAYLEMIIGHFMTFDKKVFIESDLKAIIKGDYKYVCTMMSNFLENNFQDNNFYINECL